MLGDQVITYYDITKVVVSKNMLITVFFSLQAKFFTHDRLHINSTQEEFNLNSSYIMSVK